MHFPVKSGAEDIRPFRGAIPIAEFSSVGHIYFTGRIRFTHRNNFFIQQLCVRTWTFAEHKEGFVFHLPIQNIFIAITRDNILNVGDELIIFLGVIWIQPGGKMAFRPAGDFLADNQNNGYAGVLRLAYLPIQIRKIIFVFFRFYFIPIGN